MSIPTLSMGGTRVDLEFTAGQDVAWTASFVDVLGDPLDITSSSWTAEVLDGPGGDVLATINVVENVSALEFGLTDVETAALPRRCVWHLVETAAGDRPILSGSVTVPAAGSGGVVNGHADTVTVSMTPTTVEVQTIGAGGGGAEDVVHRADLNNPHATDIGNLGSGTVAELNAALTDGDVATDADLSAHTGDTANPHTVTATQVGLENVQNTSDMNKPVSTAQAAADALVQADADAAQADATQALADAATAQSDATDALADAAAAQSTADAAQPISEKGQVDGYASLDGGGTVPDAQIPAAITRDSELTSGLAGKANTSHTHTLADVTDEGALASLDDVTAALVDSGAATDGHVLTADGAGGAAWEASAGGGASELSDLTDVGVSTPTDQNALMADGDSWESRPLVEADISDLGTYADASHTHTLTDVTDSGDLAALDTVDTTEIDDDAVTYAKIQDVTATDRILGRDTAGAGIVEELDATAVLGIIGVEAGADVTDATNVAAAGAEMATNKGAVGGYASLDGSALVPDAQIPSTITRDSELTSAINDAINDLLDGAPGALDTLNELAASIGDDADFAGTVTAALAGKQPLDADLTSIAALSTTAFGRALLTEASAATARATLVVAEELSDLTDVNTSTPTDGNVLRADGVDWESTTLAVGDLSDAGALATLDTVGATEIDNSAVTLPKLADIATDSFLGRDTAATGAVEVLSVSTTKTVLALENVDNTSDANKPVSTAQQTALDGKQDTSTELDDLSDVSAVTVGYVPTVNATQDGYDFQANVRGPLVVGSANADYITDGTADDVQIQAAIDAADTAGGGVVFIQSGTYDITAPIEMKDYVTLEGEGINATDLVLANSVDNHLITSDASTSGYVWFCTIRNMTLDGNKANNVDGDVVNMLRSHTWVVEHLQIQNASRHGVHMVGTSDPVFCINSIVKHCYISDSDDIGLKIGGYAPNNHALNNIIGTNTVSVPLVSLENTECTFIGNHVHHGAADGIEISSDRNLVIGNFVETSGANGISLTSAGSGARVEGNSITNSGFGGGGGTFSAIKIAGDRASVIGNLCIDTQGTKTQDYGIEVTSTATYNIVRSNHTLASDNLTGDILIDGGATNNLIETIDGDDIALTGTIDGNDITDMPVSATQQAALDGKQDTSTELDDLTDVSAVTVGHVAVVNATQDGYDFQANAAGAANLDELGDVTAAAQTAGFVVASSGGAYAGRALIASDIPDVSATYATTAHSHADGEIADDHSHDSAATWAQGQIVLEQSASPTPTVEGEIHWDTDDNRLKVGDGSGTQTFSNDADIAAAYQSTSTELDDLTDVSAVTVGHIPVVNATQDGYDFQANAAGASQLDELSDVTAAAQTAGFVVASSGGAYAGRALVAGDIPDVSATYATTAHSHADSEIADAHSHDSAATWAQGQIVLEQSASPTPTAEGQIEWDTDGDQIVVGDGTGQVTFSNDADNASAYAAAAHTIASHSDTTATGSELETLTDGSNADSLHVHAVGSHTIASHSDTTATGAELETLTDGSNADSLHVHTPEFADNVFRVQDDGDATKEIAFQASGITTANTRTITMPDADVNLGDMPVSAIQQTALDGKQDTSTELDDLSDVSAVTVGHVPTVNATQDGYTFVAQGGGGDEFADDVFRIQDDGDATKEIAFQASGITTSTTRTITMPDADVDLGDMPVSATQQTALDGKPNISSGIGAPSSTPTAVGDWYADTAGAAWFARGTASSSDWEKAGTAGLNNLYDVAITSPSTGQAIFRHSGGYWNNRLMVEADISDLGTYADASHTHTKDIVIAAVSSADFCTVANGTTGFVVPLTMDGMEIVDVVASVHTAGTTGTQDMQIRKRRGSTDVDVLSTVLKIDSGEWCSKNAAAHAIKTDGSEDLVEGDLIYVDIDVLHSGTAAKGLSVAISCRTP